jgi:sigma-B regulation protein RsbU (phosphoserine phosphatase)
MSAAASNPLVNNPTVESTRISRMQVWGGNCNAERGVHSAGITGWIFCRAFPPGTCGGDVYYLSACGEDLLYRVVLADVSGHGGEFSNAARHLENLIADHINTHDQSELMRQLNAGILSVRGKYATAVVLGYERSSGTLLFTTAGHPPVLWYHAATASWDMLHDETEHAVSHEGLPIGLIEDTEYTQTAVKLGESDLLVAYTDGFAEATDPDGNELGYEGLKALAEAIPICSPHQFGTQLLAAVSEFCGRPDYDDDRTLMVLKRV